MFELIRRKGVSRGVVILVLLLDAVAQWTISYTLVGGRLKEHLGVDVTSLGVSGYVLRGALLAALVACWLLERRRAVFLLVIAVNGLATIALLVHTTLLISVLIGMSNRDVTQLILDVVLMAVSNMMVFSVWYWIIDPPGVDDTPRPGERWAFLFPQRGESLPNFEAWQPGYADYFFVAFTTSFAFSPTDALPLTRGAKLLMAMQATISVVILTGIAGSAINILAGGPPAS